MADSSSSSALPPLPDDRIILGCGSVSYDYLVTVPSYPEPDDKIRSTSNKIDGGGNAGNSLTCAARLGLKPRLITQVADDFKGEAILEQLKADGVDMSFTVVSKGGSSPFTYVIVDEQTKTRTCIYTNGYPSPIPEDLSKSRLSSALDGVNLVHLDGRHHETALIIAEEASRRSIPILIDLERERKGLDDLSKLATYAVCAAKFPQAWTGAPSLPSALVSMLLRLPNLKFVIVTLGEDGCLMLEKSTDENVPHVEIDVDDLWKELMLKKDNTASPICVSSNVAKLQAKGIGTVMGRLFLGTAEKIPPSELVDTTGAGDVFIGAILYERHRLE